MSNTAQPLPSPESGSNTPPNISLVPPPAAGTAAPAAAPAPPPEAGRDSPFFLNREQLEALSLTRLIVTAAGKRAGPLETEDIDGPFLTTLLADIGLTEEKSRRAANCTTSRETCTVTGAIAERTLVHRLRKLQSSARQKHLPERPEKLQDYLIGQRIDQSRAVLEGSAQAMINKAAEERPPGVNTDFIVAARTERTAYVDSKPAQSGEQSQATTFRAERDAMMESILVRRKKIQYAADRLWPSTDPAHAGLRGEFQLPADRPYSY